MYLTDLQTVVSPDQPWNLGSDGTDFLRCSQLPGTNLHKVGDLNARGRLRLRLPQQTARCRHSPVWLAVQCLSQQVDPSIRDAETPA